MVTASVSVSPLWIPVGGVFCLFAVELRADFESPTVGVGHMRRSTALTITVNDVIVRRGPPFIRAFIAKCASGVFPSSCATGVGHNEDPVTAVRGADGGSRYAVPFRVVPDLGQVSEYSPEPQGKVPCDVLQEHESGS